jgi:hypothetical protein
MCFFLKSIDCQSIVENS